MNAVIANSKENKRPRFEPASIPGSLCRLLVAFIGALGLCLVISDSFELGLEPYAPLACGAFCLAVYLFLISLEIFAPAGIALAVLEIAGVYLTLKKLGLNDLGEIFVKGPAALWNEGVGCLVRIGYTGLAPLSLPNAGDFRVGAAVLCGIICVIFVCCTFSVPRLLPVIIVAAAPLTVVFMYNLPRSNVGFLLVVAAGLGILTMKYYRSFIRGKDKKTKQPFIKTANGGFAALALTVAVTLAGIGPALRINEPAPEATAFTGFLDRMREITYRFVSGDGPGGGRGGVRGDATSRSAMPEKRKFQNIPVLTVTAEFSTPVYLRSWTGDYYTDGVWTASAWGDAAFPYPDDATGEFYEILSLIGNGGAAERKSGAPGSGASLKYYDRGASRGFISETVTVRSEAYQSRYALVAPSLVGKRITEITNVRVDLNSVSFMKSGKVLLDTKQDTTYSMTSCVPYYNLAVGRTYSDSETFAAFAEYAEAYFKWFKGTVTEGGSTGTPYHDIIRIMRQDGLITTPSPYIYFGSGVIIYQSSGVPDAVSPGDPAVPESFYLPSPLSTMTIPAYVWNEIFSREYAGMPKAPDKEMAKAVMTMTVIELSELDARFKTVEKYNAQAVRNDTTVAGLSDGERAFLSDFIRRYGLPENCGTPKTPADAMNLAAKVSKCLADAAEYDADPRGYDASKSAVVQFLSTVRRGYCVQYATSAALILRTMGVPARYCEGFIANGFKSTSDGFAATVRDSDAHAWIEIYVENYGWMTFEMTESVSGATVGREIKRDDTTTGDTEVSAPADETTRIDDPRPPVSDTTDRGGGVTEPPVTTSEPEERKGGFPAAAIAAAVVVVLASAAVGVSALLEGRRKKFVSALSAAASRAGCCGPREQQEYTDYIFRLLGYIGLRQGAN
ncbi:MAG: transglutaminase domain-containing protein, partial [Clostridia bacterium]|nr:transglutaminase domain-containing protein [Clostridia bacterium]